MSKPISPVLECRQLSKDYWDANRRITVLTDISFSVQKGDQISIMGRSGSGKTTLLQMLGGLDKPTTGEVWMNGYHIHALPDKQLEKIRNRTMGFIYQMHHLLPEFSALENVAMPLLVGRIKPMIAAEKAKDLLAEVGLKHRLHHYPNELSGGERQRVAIARALVNEPQCVLADEPTGNLDDENASHVLEVMQKLNRTCHTSLVIVTHDSALAEKMDHAYVLHGGHLSLA